MSWDRKGVKRTYYYRSKRVDGRPVKVYVGKGTVGEQAEAEDRQARIRRESDQYHWFCVLGQIHNLSERTTQLATFSRLMTRVVLVGNGFYLHRGHEWRKRERVT